MTVTVPDHVDARTDHDDDAVMVLGLGVAAAGLGYWWMHRKPAAVPVATCPQCGANATCDPANVSLGCRCRPGFEGNPSTGCTAVSVATCPQCGANATCDPANVSRGCLCIAGFQGDPATGCTPVIVPPVPIGPACFTGSSQAVKSGMAVSQLLIGRQAWGACDGNCNCDLWQRLWSPGFYWPPDARTPWVGISAQAAWILANPVHEVLDQIDVAAAQWMTTAPGDYAAIWMSCAFRRILGRGPTSIMPQWLSIFNSHLTDRVTACEPFFASQEFSQRVAAQVAAWGG